MRHKAGVFCMTLGILLLIAAVGLLGYNRWDNWRAGQEVAEIQDALAEAEAERQSETDGDGQSGQSAENGGSGDAKDMEETAVSAQMATVEVDGYDYIGTLSIPEFGLELPVMSEWSYAGLKIAPGRYSGSVWTDDLVICGHNYTRHFGNLKNLEPGDELYFTDVDGNIFYYEVKEVVILQPTDIEEMISKESGDWDLTLYTCTLGGRTRVTVRCIRTDKTDE